MLNRIWILVAISTVMGCAKDETVDQYNAERVRQKYAQYQAIAGKYRGVLIQSEANVPMGALQLEIKVDFNSSASPGADGNPITAAPVLDTTLTFRNNAQVDIQTTKTTYDPTQGVFHAEFTIPDQPDPTGGNQTIQGGTITLTANVSGGQATGSLQVLDGQTANFSLDVNGSALDSLTHATGTDNQPPPQEQVSSFLGQTTFGTVSKPVRVIMLTPTLAPKLQFFNLLSPVKYVQLSLNYSADVHLGSATAIWDQRSGQLNANITLQVAEVV